MATYKEKIQNWVMQFSYQERRKRAFSAYEDEIMRLENLSDSEIEFEYVNLKTEYEHKKHILSILMISILLSAIMGIWKYFYTVMEQVIRFSTAYQGEEGEIVKIAFMIFFIVIIFITVMTFLILLSHMKSMRQIYRKLLIIEEQKEKRKDMKREERNEE